jgi:hypothetical protein
MHPGNEHDGSSTGRGETGRTSHSRRAFLGVATAAATSALAGCSATSGTVSAARRPPQVPTGRLDDGGWNQMDDVTQDPAFERSGGPVDLTAATRTLLYEDSGLRETIEARTLGRASAQFATFFATRATFDPDITTLAEGEARDRLLDEVESQSVAAFEARLADAGLEAVAETGTDTMTVESGEEARVTNLEATYQFDGFAVGFGDESLSVEGGEIPVAGHLATWISADSVLVTGGAYPADNFARQLTKSPSDAIDITVSVDLGFDPAAYREELFGLMKRVT